MKKKPTHAPGLTIPFDIPPSIHDPWWAAAIFIVVVILAMMGLVASLHWTWETAWSVFDREVTRVHEANPDGVDRWARQYLTKQGIDVRDLTRRLDALAPKPEDVGPKPMNCCEKMRAHIPFEENCFCSNIE